MVDDIHEVNSLPGLAKDRGLSKHNKRIFFRLFSVVFPSEGNDGAVSSSPVVKGKDCGAMKAYDDLDA